MTNERFAIAFRKVKRRLARDGFRHQLRAETRLLKNHPSSAEGNAFLEAALVDLARELDRLEGSRESEPRP
jgi:hypothetical protein